MYFKIKSFKNIGNDNFSWESTSTLYKQNFLKFSSGTKFRPLLSLSLGILTIFYTIF